MSSGLDPLTAGSINNDASTQQRSGCFGSFVSYFKCGTTGVQRNDGGYVEFGELHYDGDEGGGHKVGTFNGVFCPVVLSMFSALVFIRMGFIIGNAGLLVTLMQFAISYLILIFTVCSVCAISTNGAIQGGGVYFMISRSLGPEFGGAIGTLFFFANIVSSALCFSACTEGIIENFGPSGYLVQSLPDGHWWRTLYGSLLGVAALLINLAGARHFARTSLAIWTATTVCLLSVLLSFLIEKAKTVSIPSSNKLVNGTANYTGLSSATLSENLWPAYGHDYSDENGAQVNFAVVFGVLFSGVTGVMAGANMSGELKDPSWSIPRGTLWAIVFTGLTYVALSLLTAATCSRFLLQNNYIYMMPINIWPPFVAIGVLTATFSAGLSNMIGASRVLEALVKDNIFGAVFRWCKRPWMCVFVSWFGAQLALLGGSLTTIARANCALFLLSYLAVNLACLALELAGAPNFRPTFRWFSWHSSLCGLLGALCMMFISASLLAALALVLCLCLVISLHLVSPAAAAAPWGSISQALIFHQVRKYLLLLDARKEHVKYWRPQVLLLVSGARTAPPLARFSNQLKKGGLLVLGHVVLTNQVGDTRQLPPITPWLQLVDHLKIKAFVEQCNGGSVREGARQLIHLSGLGAMKPNTVMLGFHDDEASVDFFSRVDSPWFSLEVQNGLPDVSRQGGGVAGPAEYVALLADVLAMDKGLCVCRHFHTHPTNYIESVPGVKYIDVWLTDFINPGREDPFTVAGHFLLQMACILNTQHSWKKLTLRVMLTDTSRQGTSTNARGESSPSVGGAARSVGSSRHRLKELLNMLRIQASITLVDTWSDRVEELRERGGGPAKYDLPVDYVQGVNDMLRGYSSSETAVVFLYLPPPPEPSSQPVVSAATGGQHDDSFSTRKSSFCETERQNNMASKRRKSQNNMANSCHLTDEMLRMEANLVRECPERLKYLSLLKDFTEGLPPTVLVHGLKTVTSTAL